VAHAWRLVALPRESCPEAGLFQASPLPRRAYDRPIMVKPHKHLTIGVAPPQVMDCDLVVKEDPDICYTHVLLLLV
jgi:hypothetical protein